MDSLAIAQPSVVIDRFQEVRQQTEALAAPLSEADAQLQSMPDASPAKWHLAHTTWFFETFILCPNVKGYSRFNETYNYLFNSYYNGIGEQYPRHQRGLVSRPSLAEILEYRQAVNSSLIHWLDEFLSETPNDSVQSANAQRLLGLIELGLQHEQQHQELLLTDIKHGLFQNPLYPEYRQAPKNHLNSAGTASEWLSINGGLGAIGSGNQSFSFDNERPSHSVYIHDFAIASRLVTNGEYEKFIASGGYNNPEFWLADGWAWLQQQKQKHPLYWVKKNNQWFEFTLYGLLPLDEQKPVVHINFYEASAYANWLGARLPTEFEWEYAIQQLKTMPEWNKITLQPSLNNNQASNQLLSDAFGQVWQWTTSNYSAYPGFTPFSGVAGEYNGKFMSNQNILRGSSCVTPIGHARLTYRNFFYAHQQWQFTGIRLAK